MTSGTQSPSRRTPADAALDGPTRSDRGWVVPWKLTTAQLVVVEREYGREAAILVGGREVAMLAMPTLKDRWSECLLDGSEPAIVVGQVAYLRHRYRTVVFVDGVSIDDGLTLEDWRRRRPAAMDAFEREFSDSRFFGPYGAIGLGVVAFLAFVAGHGSSLSALVVGLALSAALSAWLFVVGRLVLIRWLVSRPSWPAPVRRLLFVSIVLGVPLLVAVLGQYVVTGR